MGARTAGALVMKLPKQPGSREHRWAHLLSGPVPIERVAASPAEQEETVTTGEIAALKSNVAQLRDQVAEMRALVEQLYKDLGVGR